MTHAIEEWRSIPGYETYEVSNHGNVRSVCRWRKNRYSQYYAAGRPVTQLSLRYGHLCVYLYPPSSKHHKRWLVHRLVLTVFGGPCPKGYECCHRDGNPVNNDLDNLYWRTRSQNQADSVRHGTHNSFQKAAWTHCRRGHEYTPENTLPVKGGSRRCRTCARQTGRRGYYARKSRAAA